MSIDIKDASGKVVKTLSGGTASGLSTVSWDGTDSDGKPAQYGEYTFTVNATNADGEAIAATQQSPAKVVAVSFKNGFPELVLDNGQTVSLGQVVEVSQTTSNIPDDKE